MNVDTESINPSVSAMDIAKEIIYQYDYEQDNNSYPYPLDELRLQKTLYFSQVFSLSFFNQQLFYENCEAWKLGPVVSAVYSTWKHNRDSLLGQNESPSAYVQFITEKILEITRAIPTLKLKDISHEHNSAWSRHYRENVRHISIPVEDIKKYPPREFLQIARDVLQEKQDKMDTNIIPGIVDLEFLR